jgi:hypothetical protein
MERRPLGTLRFRLAAAEEEIGSGVWRRISRELGNDDAWAAFFASWLTCHLALSRRLLDTSKEFDDETLFNVEALRDILFATRAQLTAIYPVLQPEQAAELQRAIIVAYHRADAVLRGAAPAAPWARWVVTMVGLIEELGCLADDDRRLAVTLRTVVAVLAMP